MEIAELLKELCDTPGASGFEGQIARHAAELMEPYVDETWIDNMGNAIGVRRCGRENADKLLFDAHIDEVGFIVTGEDNGFLRFAGLGGLDARTLPSSAV